MSTTRWITEMGMGVDVRGRDYTKAARRAVFDALRHSSLNLFNAAGKSRDDMHVDVMIGCADPDAVGPYLVNRGAFFAGASPPFALLCPSDPPNHP